MTDETFSPGPEPAPPHRDADGNPEDPEPSAADAWTLPPRPRSTPSAATDATAPPSYPSGATVPSSDASALDSWGPPVESDPRWSPPANDPWREPAPWSAATADTLTPHAQAGGIGAPLEPSSVRRGTGGRGVWRWLLAGLVGGLVGAVVATAVVLAVDDPSTTIVREVARPTATISEPADLQQILSLIEPSVVRVDAGTGAFDSGSGTGFIVGADGVIVTNAHVLSNGGSVIPENVNVIVTLPDGSDERAAVLGADPSRDLAVVKIERTGLPPATLGSSDDLQVGDDVVAIGHALGLTGDPTVTTGVVSALHRTITTDLSTELRDVVQTDAAINPGNSGGPLVNSAGEVIGINTAIANPQFATNIGWAISIDSARPILDDLEQFGSPQIAYLGVVTEDVTPAIAGTNGLEVEAGALIEEIAPDTPASEIGLEPGDVIVEVDGLNVDVAEDVREGVRRNDPGDTIEIVVDRFGERIVFVVELGLLPTGAS